LNTEHFIETHLKTTFTKYEKHFAALIREAKKKTKRVREEAYIASYEMERNRYDTLTRLLKDRDKSPKQPFQLPCHHIPFPRNPKFVERESQTKS